MIKRFHAAGGLGEAYIAEDTELDRKVALKKIRVRPSNPEESRRRYLVEAGVTAYLEHPGVVPVHGLVKDEAGEPAYAMRFIKGKTLKEAIHDFHGGRVVGTGSTDPNQEPMSSDDDISDLTGAASVQRSATLLSLLQRFVAVCNTIAYADQRGVIHRDIKPANIMFGEFGEAWVVDWGLSKVLPQPDD
jgi:serine/threonine protein kinase